MRSVLLLLILTVLLGSATTVLAEQGDVTASIMQGQASDDLLDDLYADDEDELVADPLEAVNRGIFWFNDKLYFYLLKPLARGFRWLPEPLRSGVGNMYDNLKSPIRGVNALLQLKFKQAAVETGRLVVNSTLGVGGFYDPAESWWQWKKKDEDFGQTLGYYGVGEGFYVVLPVLGSSTLRDGVARWPDRYADPLFWLVRDEVLWGLKGGEIVNRVSLDKDTYESIVEEQLDPYLFVRDAYLQRRAAKVAD